MVFYTSLFQQSLRIVRRHPFLWIFGFLTLLWAGKGVELEVFFTNARLFRDASSPFRVDFWNPQHWATISNTAGSSFVGSIDALTLGTIVVLVVVSVVLAVVVLMMAQVVLVDAFAFYGKKKVARRRYTFHDGIIAAERHVWQVLLVNLLGKGISYGVVAFVAAAIVLSAETTPNVLFILLLFLCTSALGVFLALVIRYSVNYLVVMKLSVTEAIMAGTRLLLRNAGVSLEMIALMGVAYLAWNIGALLIGAIVALPFVFLGFVCSLLFQSAVGLYVGVYLLGTMMLLAIGFSSILFATWHAGNWTLLFLELTKGEKRALLRRILHDDASWWTSGK